MITLFGSAWLLDRSAREWWIEPADDGHILTEAGYAAIGQQRPGTKLAALVMAPRRPQGATSLCS